MAVDDRVHGALVEDGLPILPDLVEILTRLERAITRHRRQHMGVLNSGFGLRLRIRHRTLLALEHANV